MNRSIIILLVCICCLVISSIIFSRTSTSTPTAACDPNGNAVVSSDWSIAWRVLLILSLVFCMCLFLSSSLLSILGSTAYNKVKEIDIKGNVTDKIKSIDVGDTLRNVQLVNALRKLVPGK